MLAAVQVPSFAHTDRLGRREHPHDPRRHRGADAGGAGVHRPTYSRRTEREIADLGQDPT